MPAVGKYRINEATQRVLVGPSNAPGWFQETLHFTWTNTLFLQPGLWHVTAEEEPTFRRVRDDLIGRGLLPDE
jgi:hypothetical protein